jgi:hypothetical protein
MREIGARGNTVAKAFILQLQELNMMEIGLMENITDLVSFIGQMEASTEVNGRIVEKMVKDSLKV